jgi:hypothetical protein
MTAMMARGGFEPANDGAEGGGRQPAGDGAAQDAFAAERGALAGDDQHMADAGGMGAHQEGQKQPVRLALRQTVQVDTGLQRDAALGQFLPGRPVDAAARLLRDEEE